MQMLADRKRNFGLDLMRAIAILLVVYGHGYLLLEGKIPDFFGRLIFTDGVEIFFVLSGFLIGGIIIKELKNNTSKFSLLEFWKRRWFRTLPNYYLILLINLLLAKSSLNSDQYSGFSWKYLFFLQNFNWYFYGFFNVSWSLAVEEWFYILFPILLLIIARIKFIGAFDSILIASIILFLISIVYRFYIGQNVFNLFQWDFKLRKVVLCRLDALMVGVVMALVFDFKKKIFIKWRHFFLVVAVLGFFLINSLQGFPTSPFYKYIYLSIKPILISFFIPFIFSIDVSSIFIKKIITSISIWSYSVYLIHPLILDFILKFFKSDSTILSLGHFGLFVSTTFVMSYFLYTYYEKPITNLRDQINVRMYIQKKLAFLK